jgi:HAE1 family hydrophobic/amphiphilic exporter-1
MLKISDEMVPFSAFMKLERYTVYQRLQDTTCTHRQRLVVRQLWDIVVVRLLKLFKKWLQPNYTRGYDIDWAGISADEVAQIKRFGCS